MPLFPQHYMESVLIPAWSLLWSIFIVGSTRIYLNQTSYWRIFGFIPILHYYNSVLMNVSLTKNLWVSCCFFFWYLFIFQPTKFHMLFGLYGSIMDWMLVWAQNSNVEDRACEEMTKVTWDGTLIPQSKCPYEKRKRLVRTWRPGSHLCQVSSLTSYSFSPSASLCSLEGSHYEKPILTEWGVMLPCP